MKVFILAGGLGSRISEYTKTIPKPMIKVGKKPILQHIMNIYLKWGYNDFYIATGYKSIVIKKFFKKFKRNNSKFEHILDGKPCTITLLDTGVKTMTGGRLKFMKNYFDNFYDFISKNAITTINTKDPDLHRALFFNESKSINILLDNLANLGLLMGTKPTMSSIEKLESHKSLTSFSDFFYVSCKIWVLPKALSIFF